MALCAGLRRPFEGTRDPAGFAEGPRAGFAVADFAAAFFFEFGAAVFGDLRRLRRAAGFFVLLLLFPVRPAISALHKINQNQAIRSRDSRCVMDHPERKLWPRAAHL
jgi:hypothetical protein